MGQRLIALGAQDNKKPTMNTHKNTVRENFFNLSIFYPLLMVSIYPEVPPSASSSSSAFL